MKHWDKSCFLKKPMKIMKFKPELEYKLIKFNNAKKKFITKFPIMKNVKSEKDLKKLKITEIGRYSLALIQTGEAFVKILNKIYGKDELKKMIITDGNGGLGGLSIHLAEKCKFLNTSLVMFIKPQTSFSLSIVLSAFLSALIPICVSLSTL